MKTEWSVTVAGFVCLAMLTGCSTIPSNTKIGMIPEKKGLKKKAFSEEYLIFKKKDRQTDQFEF